MATMRGVLLPGGRQVEIREFPIPRPGFAQVLLRMKASSICGSDIRAIYREHLGTGPEAYQGVIAGHEPAGEVVQVGPGCKELKEGDRVAVYHISGCGVCDECRHGYMIACRSEHRAAYGWQRDGGHADYMVAEENTCVKLPDSLSYADGALCACGFGTCYEALTRIGLSGCDRLLITGLGPVGLAAAMLGRAMGVRHIVGADVVEQRVKLAERLGLVDTAFVADGGDEQVMSATGGVGCEASIDCSGAPAGRWLALAGTREWGRSVFVGEGGTVEFDVSQMLIHRQITLYGSWVTSLRHLQDLMELLDRRGLRPEQTVIDRFPLDDAAEAYRVADEGRSGKVCIVMDD